ncbi:MAG: DUF5681 domain-containing protein [Anderseniella sp.]|jgi:hypothetical protein|nr:DUF5681 domain-containing protein [Anderseniella sp.]
MSDQNDEDAYEVGYGRPPKSTRFRKGQSGNPKGRPKEARGVLASLKRELDSPITIREGNREVRVSKAEAMAKRVIASALKGDQRVVLTLLKLDAELYGTTPSEPGLAADASKPSPVDYDILRDFFAEMSASAGDTSEDGEISDADA